eukprot:6459338-Amphidinium_carterae.2
MEEAASQTIEQWVDSVQDPSQISDELAKLREVAVAPMHILQKLAVERARGAIGDRRRKRYLELFKSLPLEDLTKKGVTSQAATK